MEYVAQPQKIRGWGISDIWNNHILKFEVNVFSKLMADADNSYWDTQFHETQFSIELHTEIMHCAHN